MMESGISPSAVTATGQPFFFLFQTAPRLDKSTQTILTTCAVLGVILVIAVLALVVWLLWTPPKRICTTQYCSAHAAILKAAMNTSVHPCDNFYKFTCGSWKPRGHEKSIIGYAFAQTAQIAIQEMNKTLGSAIPAAPTYFQSCLKKTNIQNELELFKGFKQGLGLMWPEKPQTGEIHPLDALLNMSIKWNYHMFFHLRAMPEYRKRPPTLYIRRGKLHPGWQSMSLEQFSGVVKRHLEALGINARGSSDSELFDVVRDMMKHCIHKKPDATSDTQLTLNEVFEYMQHNSARLRATVSEMLAPRFTWYDTSPVFLEDASILERLDDLLKMYERKVSLLMQGLSWVFLRDNLWVVVGDPSLRHSGDREKLQEELMRACLAYVESSFGLVVLSRHLHARYDEAMKKKLGETFSGVKHELSKDVKNAPWIDENIKRKIENKLRDLRLNALPDKLFFSTNTLVDLYKSFSTSVSESFMESYINLGKAYHKILGTETYVSIYSKNSGKGEPSRYNYYYNFAFLSLGAMQPPILYPGGMIAATFGSVGTLLGECMVRSFDTRGVVIDEKGEARGWWGPGYPNYTERAECDLIGDSDLVVIGGDPVKRKGLFSAKFPLGPALTASFAAFRTAVIAFYPDGNVEDLRLPGLEEYSDEQLFFMTYCLMRCSREGDGRDCNLAVRHTPAFAHAFRCSPGSRMNPRVKQKCGFLV